MLKRASAKAKAEAIRLVGCGTSVRETAASVAKRFRCDVSATAVRRWVREAAALADVEDAPESEPAPAAPEAPAPDAAGTAEELDSDDLVDQTRRMLRDAKRLVRQASADGNHAAAQRAQRDALNFTGILARLEKERASTVDGIHFTREQLEAARASITERTEKLAADLSRTGGLVCSQCGCEIRIRLAKGEL